MISLRIVVPPDATDDVVRYLSGDRAVTNVVLLTGAAVSPAGDLVLCDVAREEASLVLQSLEDRGIAERGAIALQAVDTAIGPGADRAVEQARGAPADAVVWEEVQAKVNEESTLSVSYLVFMVAAMLIAAVGIIQDSPVLIVGAMVVGPEFGPLAAFVVAVVQRRAREARASLSALLVGFAVGIMLTLCFALLVRATDLVSGGELSTARTLTAFISHPDAFSLIAGVAGHLSLTASKSATLVGVLVSVTTVPAAANIAVAAAFADWTEARGAATQLAVNLLGIVAAGVITLTWQQHRAGPRPGSRVGDLPAGRLLRQRVGHHRAPIPISSSGPLVVSQAVWCSASKLISTPNNTM